MRPSSKRSRGKPIARRADDFTVLQSRVRGVFCLETDTSMVARAPSVFSLLGILRSSPLHIPSIHRHVATKDSFLHYIEKWTQRQHESYPILYLAMHGVTGEVQFGDLRLAANCVRLDELEKVLTGRCKGRVIHFSSCKTLVLRPGRTRQFLERSGAVAVSGYRRDIDWMRSAILDLGLLTALQQNAFTASGMHAVKARMTRRYGHEVRSLGLHMTVRGDR